MHTVMQLHRTWWYLQKKNLHRSCNFLDHLSGLIFRCSDKQWKVSTSKAETMLRWHVKLADKVKKAMPCKEKIRVKLIPWSGEGWMSRCTLHNTSFQLTAHNSPGSVQKEKVLRMGWCLCICRWQTESGEIRKSWEKEWLASVVVEGKGVGMAGFSGWSPPKWSLLWHF